MRNVFYHFPLCSIYYESYDSVLQSVSIKAENKYGWPWEGVKKTFSDPPPSAPYGDKKNRLLSPHFILIPIEPECNEIDNFDEKNWF